MKKRLILGVLVLLAVVFASPLGLAQEDLADRQVIVFGIPYPDIGGMDPHLAPSTVDKTVVEPLFNGLVRFKPGNMNPEFIEPDLAESWEISDDYLVWTFHLRQGVQFHHGYGELTADDVVYSLERSADPDRSTFSSDYVIFEKFEAVDPYTVEITLKDPVPEIQVLAFLTDYQGGYIVSKAAAEEYGNDFRTNPIGTGPFQLKEYRSRELVRYEPNKEYFRGEPYLEEFTIRLMPELRSRELAFQTGELDIIVGARESWWVEDIREFPGTVVDVVGPVEMRTLHFNMSRPPFDDIRIRQAIAYSIDAEEICEVIGAEVTTITYSPVPPEYYASTDDVKKYHYDPEKATELLAEAGHPDGIHLGTVISTERDTLLAPMQIIQDQLARNNIRIDLEVVDHTTFHERIRENLSGMVLYGAARFPTPDQYLTQFYHSRSIVGTPTAVTNFSHYGDVLPGIDHLIDGARVELDVDKQWDMWVEAQQQIMEDLPTYPIYGLMQVFVRKDHIYLGYEFDSTLSLTIPINEETRIINK